MKQSFGYFNFLSSSTYYQTESMDLDVGLYNVNKIFTPWYKVVRHILISKGVRSNIQNEEPATIVIIIKELVENDPI